MKNPIHLTACTTVLALTCGAIGGATAAEIEWHYSAWGNPRAFTSGVDRLAEYVAEQSDGNFTINVHYGEAISPAKENIDGIKIGAFQAAMVSPAYTPGKLPLQGVINLPLLPIPNLDVQEKVAEAFYDHPAVEAEWANWNARPHFAILAPSFEAMGSGDPPTELADWKGMRVRALAGIGDAMRQLGAVPTTVPAPEVYTGIERGLFRAATFPFSYAFGAFRIHEVSSWYTENMNLGVALVASVYNIDAFDELPSEYQDLLREAVPHIYSTMKEGYREADEKWLPAFREAGLEEVVYTEAQLAELHELAAEPVWKSYVGEMEEKDLPGRELLDLILKEAATAE